MMRPSKPWSRPCSARSSIDDSSAIACAVCLRLAATRLSRRGGAVTPPAAELSFYFAAAAQLEPALRPAFTERVRLDARRTKARRRRPWSPPSTDRAVGPAERDR